MKEDENDDKVNVADDQIIILMHDGFSARNSEVETLNGGFH